MGLKEYFPQGVRISEPRLPSSFPRLPDSVLKRFPEVQDYLDETDRFWKKVRAGVSDLTEEIARDVSKQTGSEALSIRLGELAARIEHEESVRLDGDTALATIIDSLIVAAGTTSTVFVQPSTPTAIRVNDLWFDSDDGFRRRYWDGDSWEDVTDANLLASIAAVTSAQTATASSVAAQATLINGLLASVGAAEATILTISSTYATKTFAEAKRDEAISAAIAYTDDLGDLVGTLSADITTNYATKVYADGTAAARRAEAIAAASADAAAKVLVEQNARVAADGALSTSLNAVSATVQIVADTYTLVPGANCSLPVSGISTGVGSILKSGGANGVWDAGCYSNEGHTNGAYCSFRAHQTNLAFMAGLNVSAGLADPNYTSLAYAWCANSDGTTYIFESGVAVAHFLTPYTTNTDFTVLYDGVNVSYLLAGVLMRQTPAPANLTLYFDSSFFELGTRLNRLRFGQSNPATALVAVESVARAAADGSLYGMWGVSINLDGHVVGRVRLDGTGSTSSFLIAVDKFQLTNANGTLTPLEIRPGGVLVFGADAQSDNYVAGVAGWFLGRDGDVEFRDAVIRGTLHAADLVLGTIPYARFPSGVGSPLASVGGASTISGTTPQLVPALQTTVTMPGTQKMVIWSGYIANASGGLNDITLYLFRGGTQIGITQPQSVPASLSQNGSFTVTDTPPAGTYTYSVRASGSNLNNIVVGGELIIQ